MGSKDKKLTNQTRKWPAFVIDKDNKVITNEDKNFNEPNKFDIPIMPYSGNEVLKLRETKFNGLTPKIYIKSISAIEAYKNTKEPDGHMHATFEIEVSGDFSNYDKEGFIKKEINNIIQDIKNGDLEVISELD